MSAVAAHETMHRCSSPNGLSVWQEVLKELDADGSVRLGPLHYLRMRVTRELMAAALAVEDLATALRAATALLPYYHAVYPKASEPLGLHRSAADAVPDVNVWQSLRVMSSQSPTTETVGFTADFPFQNSLAAEPQTPPEAALACAQLLQPSMAVSLRHCCPLNNLCIDAVTGVARGGPAPRHVGQACGCGGPCRGGQRGCASGRFDAERYTATIARGRHHFAGRAAAPHECHYEGVLPTIRKLQDHAHLEPCLMLSMLMSVLYGNVSKLRHVILLSAGGRMCRPRCGRSTYRSNHMAELGESNVGLRSGMTWVTATLERSDIGLGRCRHFQPVCD